MKIRFMVLALLFSVALGCAKTPPNLTPQAAVAFNGLQAVRALDLLRDTAIAANAQNPPILDNDATRKVVLYHQSAIKVIQTAPAGWKATVSAGLTELVNSLAPPQRGLLAPYVMLLKSVIGVV